MSGTAISNLLGLVGAAIGGLVGVLAFEWILRQDFYAMILPGAMLGFGAELLARHRSRARGIACALAALILGIFAEWRAFPWAVDTSLGYFLGHLQELRPITWLMIAVGTFLAYRWGGDSFRPGLGPDRPPA